jgi:Circadian oscillating protein COP23
MKFTNAVHYNKRQLLTLCLVTGTMTGQAILPLAPSHAVTAAATKFVCGTSQGIPATVAKTKKGDVPIIIWKSVALNKSGYNPEVRCQQVSARFQTLYRSGQLKYLTAGKLNNLPVICATIDKSSNCTNTNLLYTLKLNESAPLVIKKLQSIRNQATNRGVDESGSITSDRSVNLDWLEDEN